MVNKITSLAEYFAKYKESVADPDGFWGDIAESHYWQKKWDRVLEYKFKGEGSPDVNWFVNGKLNITENIFERNMFMRKDQVAIIWEPTDRGPRRPRAHRHVPAGLPARRPKRI